MSLTYVEIDSTFYNIPSIITVNNWARRTPEDFKFSAKFPRIITHEKRLKDIDQELDQFFDAIGPLSNKTLALLIQLPPSMQIFEGLESLRDLVPKLDPGFRYAVEVRHPSWYQDLAYNFFANNGICLVWSQLAEIKTPPIVTTDFLYLRVIGDRSIHEKDFGRIQIDRVVDMQKWVDNLKTIEDKQDKQINLAYGNGFASSDRRIDEVSTVRDTEMGSSSHKKNSGGSVRRHWNSVLFE